jgi:hypothetical protein
MDAIVSLDDVTFCKELLGHVSYEVSKPDLCCEEYRTQHDCYMYQLA